MDILKTVHVRGTVLALALGLAGCGGDAKPYAGEVYPVKGQVLLASGKPLTGGRVHFLPKEMGGMPASGDIGSDGSYTLKTADSRDGAAPGDYKVRIEPSADLKGTLGKPKPLPFASSYTDIDGDTGLTATVKAEATTIPPFQLTAKSAPKADRGRD